MTGKLDIYERRMKLLEQVGRRVVGQQDVVDSVLCALFSGGHSLLVGVPGLAKTLLILTFSRAMGLNFNRIQFTPDLMPGDITGTDVLETDRETGERVFRFHRGPLFTNVLLADEVNRTPPKTQAALLQAMQEYKVSTSGQTFDLEAPFFVLATQNPIEQEGTYPLPEAQLDRFMFEILVDYPSHEEELMIIKTTTGIQEDEVDVVFSREDILAIQKQVREVPVPDNVYEGALRIVRDSRPQSTTIEQVKESVRWGAGPRAGQYLILGSKARALMNGRENASLEDVRAVATEVLRHRIVLHYHAQAEGITPDKIIQNLLQTTVS
jgi:MoxR-like ATPase